ncbi:MAG: signal recognition particle receptor subunit alpha, partial [Vampirovibrionales bacterium]|nr:signal recognition particle receptor subunit alpha [Vampirovibrionales bacterium]
MLDQLSQRLQQSLGVASTLSSMMGLGGGTPKTLTETDLDQALRDIRRALLEADVNLRAIQTFLARVREDAIGKEILKGLNPQQQLVDIVHQAMIALLGHEQRPLSVLAPSAPDQLGVILLFGLQGSGKTTTAAKLALWLHRQHHKRVLLVAADTVRPAAIDQLLQMAARAEKLIASEVDDKENARPQSIAVHHVPSESDMQAIVASGFERAKTEGYDVLLIDTAGRQQIDPQVMAQLLILERSLLAKGWISAANPLEKLLVLDAMMGQEAVGVGEAFESQIGLTGLVMTKLDGDSRGGAMLSVVEATKCPIKLIGTGEGLDGLEAFYPDRMASRILGMGDVLTLVEKAQQAVSEEDTLGMLEKF